MDRDAIIKAVVKVVTEELGTEKINLNDPKARNVVLGTGWFGCLMTMRLGLWDDSQIEAELRRVAKKIKEISTET